MDISQKEAGALLKTGFCVLRTDELKVDDEVFVDYVSSWNEDEYFYTKIKIRVITIQPSEVHRFGNYTIVQLMKDEK
jgi:hypothetical protein